MAKGDYAEIERLSTKMNEMTMKASMNSTNTVEPIQASIYLNQTANVAIDPDAVVLESAGVIALKKKEDNNSSKGRISVYVDPKSLKNSKTLSRFEFKYPEEGSKNKMEVHFIMIELNGPMTSIEAWVKKLNTKSLLGLIP
jgi:hypothetical protein